MLILISVSTLIYADVAELADALVLGTSVNDVGVQVPSSAPKRVKIKFHSLFLYFVKLILCQKSPSLLPYCHRISQIDETARNEVQDYINLKHSKYTGFNFEFNPYSFKIQREDDSWER